MKVIFSLLICAIMLENASYANKYEVIADSTELTWHWENDFSIEEQVKLKEWIKIVYKATQKTLGTYQFVVDVHFHRTDPEGKAVQFGFSSRKNKKNAVHYYVNPTASLSDLLSDWIAPHELSHLAIPFVGKKSMWFTEGFATYFSRKIMMDLEKYTPEEFDALYFRKICDTKRYYNSSTKTFAQVSDSLTSAHNYSAMYWGGTSFFYLIDKGLKQQHKEPFIKIIQRYQTGRRKSDRNMGDVLESFNQIAGVKWFTDLVDVYNNKPAYKIMEAFEQ